MNKLIFKKELLGLLLSAFATIGVSFVGWHTGLFWDNVLFINIFSSNLLENGPFAWGSIPTIHDPGHPMLAATYIACIWKVFGRSLTITHLALIPFILTFWYLLWQIILSVFSDFKWALAAFLLVFADTSVFSQVMYIGPEIFVLCFSSIAIYGILKRSFLYQTIGLMLLGITTLRGMMLCAGIFLWDLCKNHKINIYSYLIGALPAVAFILWRLIVKGWIISNPLAPWGNAFGYGDAAVFARNFIRNGIVLSSRIIDFGRIVPAVMVFALLTKTRKQWILDKRITDLLLFTTLICCIIAITSLVIINPMGHSYFLWIYIGIELLLISLLQHIKWHKLLYGCVLSALLLGNTIIYPERIAEGWPCTLASLPYWSLRSDMLLYMEKENITPKETLTFFPFGSCADDVDLKRDKRKYATSWEEAKYVLSSNICNLDDETLDRLQTLQTIKRYEKRGVHLTLYQITP